MREIKFRGKDIENGIFLFGDLRQRIGFFPAIIESYCTDEGKVGYREIAVDPKTVGQYTGLKDKNGNHIYEGDIIRTPLGRLVVVSYGRKEHLVRRTHPAVTDSFTAYGWIVTDVNNESNYDFLDDEICCGEVIGNIHDNPELKQTEK